MDRFLESAVFKKCFVFILAVVLTACAGTPLPTPTPAPEQVDGEQQAVYAALLHGLYSSSNFVIMDTSATSPGGVGDTASILVNILQNMHGVDAHTADNFRARNDASYPVSPRMDLGVPYVLLTRDQMTGLFNQTRTAGSCSTSSTRVLRASPPFHGSASMLPLTRRWFMSAP
jgi:hypothetical protein